MTSRLPSRSIWPVVGGRRRHAAGVRRADQPGLQRSAALLLVWGWSGWIGSFGMADATDEMRRRRRFLNRLSLALSGLAGAVVSVPIVAYLLSPLLSPPPRGLARPRAGRRSSRSARPSRSPSTSRRRCLGRPDRATAVWLRRDADATSPPSPSTAPTWAARSTGGRAPSCSCARATAASTTPTAPSPAGRRRSRCPLRRAHRRQRPRPGADPAADRRGER